MLKSGVSNMTFKEELAEAFPVYNDEIDTSFLLELLYYFPIDKTYISTGSYDQYLYDLEKTVIDNYDVGNFQVSFFYAHLIFMSYVYYCVERAYQLEPERMKDVFYPINAYNGRKDKPDLDSYQSVYDFSKIPEKEIFKVFRILGMDHAQIRDLAQYISDRDDYAHATGKGNISEDALVQNIRTITGNMETLCRLFYEEAKMLYIKYLLEYADYDYESIVDSAFDFIYDHEFSISDIEYLCNLGISCIRNENEEFKDKYRFVKKAHCAFLEYCIENFGIIPPENYTSLRDEAYLFYRYKDHADDYVENELGISAYECVKGGREFPVYECPDCGEKQFAYDAENGKYHCFACDVNYTTDDYNFCENCGELKPTGEATCDACFQYAIEKD